jgi:hypothetical protein
MKDSALGFERTLKKLATCRMCFEFRNHVGRRCENKMVGNVFEPQTNQQEELRNLYSSSNIARVIKSGM